jgi:hypothetical protein
MAILTTCNKRITTVDTTNHLFERVWIHFWIPQTIISDRDKRLLNTFWSSLWSLLDTKLTKSTDFHPQNDDQIEVINQMIVHILRMYNSKHPRTWDESLPYIYYNYNMALHSSNDHNPFQVGLGFKPLGPIDVALPFGSFAHFATGLTLSPRIWVAMILSSTLHPSLTCTQCSMWTSFDHIFHHYWTPQRSQNNRHQLISTLTAWNKHPLIE